MKRLRENLPLKIASLVLAIGVWMYVRGEERPVQIVSAPLELQNLPGHLAIAGDVSQSVSIRVRAPEVLLRSLDDQPPLARADLSGLSDGDQFVRIGADAIRIPPGIEVLRITPEQIPIRLEKKIRKNLPVSVRIAGEPAPGFELGDVNVQPERVSVEGPESVVKEAHEVLTAVVRIDGRALPFDVAVNLYPDRAGAEVIPDSTAVISIDIHERYARRVLDGVAVTAPGGEGGLRFDPPVVRVTVEGIPSALGDLEPGSVAAIVDVEEVPAGRAGVRLRPRAVLRTAEFEGRVFIRSIEPEEITVRRASGRAR